MVEDEVLGYSLAALNRLLLCVLNQGLLAETLAKNRVDHERTVEGEVLFGLRKRHVEVFEEKSPLVQVELLYVHATDHLQQLQGGDLYSRDLLTLLGGLQSLVDQEDYPSPEELEVSVQGLLFESQQKDSNGEEDKHQLTRVDLLFPENILYFLEEVLQLVFFLDIFLTARNDHEADPLNGLDALLPDHLFIPKQRPEVDELDMLGEEVYSSLLNESS